MKWRRFGETLNLGWETASRTSSNHLHREVRAPTVSGNRVAKFPLDFVPHSLRNTILTRLGESGVKAFNMGTRP